MSNWIDLTEAALTEVYNEKKIPYDFEFFRAESLPDTYMVYFLVSNPPLSAADNKQRSSVARIQVSLFYKDIQIMKSIPELIKTKMKKMGFLVSAEGRIPYQKDTCHYGWRCEFIIYQN